MIYNDDLDFRFAGIYFTSIQHLCDDLSEQWCIEELHITGKPTFCHVSV